TISRRPSSRGWCLASGRGKGEEGSVGRSRAPAGHRSRPFPLPSSHFPRFFPGSWSPPGLIVEEEDDRPDLALREKVLPLRHRRVPRRALARQTRPALCHAPEHEALRELRDGAVVLEVGRERIEAGGEMPLAVEVV